MTTCDLCGEPYSMDYEATGQIEDGEQLATVEVYECVNGHRGRQKWSDGGLQFECGPLFSA